MSVIIAGIGTDVGKTVVSAIVCQALRAEYWKPVQAGDLDNTDTDKVRALVSFKPFVAHKETYALTQPMSPHAAAKLDHVTIEPEKFIRPKTGTRALVTELAGGMMVPLSDSYLTIDLARDIGDPLIVVANSYLGSINHTLLTLDLIAKHGLSLVGLVFNGDTNPDSRDIILNYSGVPVLADIPKTDDLTQNFVKTYAEKIRNQQGLARL